MWYIRGSLSVHLTGPWLDFYWISTTYSICTLDVYSMYRVYSRCVHHTPYVLYMCTRYVVCTLDTLDAHSPV